MITVCIDDDVIIHTSLRIPTIQNISWFCASRVSNNARNLACTSGERSSLTKLVVFYACHSERTTYLV